MPQQLGQRLYDIPSLTVSDILPLMDCNYKGSARFSSQSWVAPSVPMKRGSGLHLYVENLLKNKAPDPAFLDREVLESLRLELAPLIAAADANLCPPPFQLLGVEEALQEFVSFENYDFYLNIRPDFVCILNGKIYSGQIKTIGRGMPVGPALERVRMSFHEGAYRTILRRRGFNIEGTLLLVFRTYLTKEQKANNVPVFESFALPATEEEDKLLYQDLLRSAIQLLYYTTTRNSQPGPLRTVYPPVRNWSACTSLLGTCPLYEHCHHGAPIKSCLPVPLTDRYPEFPRYSAANPPTPAPTVAANSIAEIAQALQQGVSIPPPNQRPRNRAYPN